MDWPGIGTCRICGEENVRSIPFNAGYAWLRPGGKTSGVDRWRCIHVTDEKPRDLAAEIDALKTEVARLRFLTLGED